jgi:hypothetical protein
MAAQLRWGNSRARGRLAAWVLSATLLTALGWPALALAHVNRQVGPYTILVVLVEEPTFEDNHAGFQFWIRRGSHPIFGLERSIEAGATGHGTTVDLRMPAADALGFYVLDRTSDGTAFDPLGGGPWSLHLTGSIDGTPLDESFAVTFPSYPRVGKPQPVGAGGSASEAEDSTVPVTLLAAAFAVVALVGLRLRPRRAQPTPAR